VFFFFFFLKNGGGVPPCVERRSIPLLGDPKGLTSFNPTCWMQAWSCVPNVTHRCDPVREAQEGITLLAPGAKKVHFLTLLPPYGRSRSTGSGAAGSRDKISYLRVVES